MHGRLSSTISYSGPSKGPPANTRKLRRFGACVEAGFVVPSRLPPGEERMSAGLEESEELRSIREGVRALCQRFPGEYWREKDRERAYPTEFVQALTEAGYLGALIPEEYGGAGLPLSAAAAILEEIHRSGGNAGACHAQMYIMGTILRHGSEAQKRQYLPKIATGELRLQAFGVTEPTTGSDTTQLKTTATRRGDTYIVRGQKVFISRAEYSDLLLLVVRTTPIEQVKKRTDGLSILLVDLRK